MDEKQIAGFLLGIDPSTFMKTRDDGEGGLVVIGPDGKKYKFTAEQLEKGRIAMETPTIEEVAKPKPAPKPAPKPKRKPSTKQASSRKG